MDNIDVLMLTFKDLSNTGWRTSKCLELLGLNVKFFKSKSHIKYTEEAEICKMKRNNNSSFPLAYECKELKHLAEQAKVIHFIAGTFVDTGVDLSKKKVIIQYGGRPYMTGNQRRRCNRFFNNIADATIIQYPMLLGHGAKNEHLIYYPVDTDFLQPEFDRNSEKVIIGHFPSNPRVKGTKTILKVINELENDKKYKDKFEYIGKRDLNKKMVGWLDHLEKFKTCDVVIETVKSTFKKNKFGEWGNSALESASLGKIVVTNSIRDNIYQKEYGDNSLHIANNENQLKNQLIKIINMSAEEIQKEKMKSRQWVEEKHSFESTSKRLWKKIYKGLI